jgi:hypothetical protein
MTCDRTQRRTVRAWQANLSAICLTGITAVACADWPDDPASPLALGGVFGISGPGAATVVTPDGATWAAWIDKECLGSLRLQRVDSTGALLVPGALALDPVSGCVGRAARLAACADGSVVTSGVIGSANGDGPLGDMPVHRIGPDGASMWGDGVIVADNMDGNIGGFLALAEGSGDGGDVLIAWHAGMQVFVGRFAADGSPVWRQPASIAVPHGPTMRIFGVVADGENGAYVIWDTPDTYTRTIFAARFTGEGAAAWASPLHLTAVTPSSKHTDPVAIADGEGGAVVVWTLGIEQSDLPSELYMQRITAEGSLVFDPEGTRVSLDATRQFSAVVSRDGDRGDLFIAWRDGVAQQTLRAQRLTPAGERVWGGSGVAVAPLGRLSNFDATWNVDAFAIALANVSASPNVPRVNVHRVDEGGAVAAEPWPVSGTQAAAGVRIVAMEDALAVTWSSDGAGFNDQAVAQRLNSDGTLGLPARPTEPADLNGDGAVNGADLGLLLGAWGACDECPEDLNGDGGVDGADLGALLTVWTG